MTKASDVEPKDHAAAKREIRASVARLVAVLVVLILAMRGFWSSMWNFPLIFGGIIAVLALLSLRVARRVLWKPRLALAIVTVVACALLHSLHVRGVQAKMVAYEQRSSDALLGTTGPPIPFVAAIHLGDDDRGSFEPSGRISLLNFWATWCGPCVEEIPLLQEFWSEGRSKGIDVIGVTKLYDDIGPAAEADQIEAFLTERAASYPIVIADSSSTAHADYRVESLPTSILVDRDGRIVGVGAGIRGTMRLMKQAEELADASPVELD